MEHAKPPRTPTAAQQAPWTAVVEITSKGDVFEPGDDVPDSLVKKNRWLVDAGRVEGQPKTAKSKKGK